MTLGLFCLEKCLNYESWVVFYYCRAFKRLTTITCRQFLWPIWWTLQSIHYTFLVSTTLPRVVDYDCNMFIRSISVPTPSVTRWSYYFFNIWPLTAKKFAQLHEKFIKLGATFCPNRPFKFAKVAKLRQIWSHCLRPMKYLLVSKIWVNFATKCDCKNNQINILVHFISAHLSGCAKFWTYGKV